ncbi:hypothetical protein BH10CYA1_BH10CYA1_24110 [soil metagenome]
MKLEWLISISLMASMTSALAANPEWDQATRLYNSGDYRAALSAFRKISEKNPSEPTAHYMLAQCYKNSGNTKQAITELEWISNSTSDQRVKGPADSLLAQIRSGAGAGAATHGAGHSTAGLPPGTYTVMPVAHGPIRYRKQMIPGAISPLTIPIPGTIMTTPLGRYDGTIQPVTTGQAQPQH